MIKNMFRPIPIPLALSALLALGVMEGSVFIFFLAIYIVGKCVGAVGRE
jgi:hypothetical protein